MEVSVHVLEGNSPIGFAENLRKGRDVFWGVPRFFPSTHAWLFGNGQPYSVYDTIARVKQAFQVECAGLIPAHCSVEIAVRHNEYPVDNDIYLRSDMTFMSPGAEYEKKASILFRVLSRKVRGNAIHMTIGRVFFKWLS